MCSCAGMSGERKKTTATSKLTIRFTTAPNAIMRNRRLFRSPLPIAAPLSLAACERSRYTPFFSFQPIVEVIKRYTRWTLPEVWEWLDDLFSYPRPCPGR